QAVLDALVVAGLEVQARKLQVRAPVAPVQDVGAAHAHRPGDRLAVQLGQYDYQGTRHRRGQVLQELQGQRRRVAVVGECGEVEAVHGGQVVRGGLVAVDDA